MTAPRRKLIEVALPLDAINAASAKEKSIRHGHPSTLHLWWARRPLAACRAVLFASLVDDPSAHPDQFPTEEDQAAERKRLFGIIERFVPWENSNNPEVLAEAREAIVESCDGDLPPVLDPFAGGGSIPLEAQRLGLEAHASDLNPVAVLINKALIEIPPRFANRPPVHPDQQGAAHLRSWPGAQGLAADVRYYGKWMREEAERRIGHRYPKVKLPAKHGGGEATVIAWLWARTVRSPNPAWDGHVPLVRSFVLSNKRGQRTWIEPLVDRVDQLIRYKVRSGPSGDVPEGTVGRRGARCLATGTAMPFSYVREEARAGRMSHELIAIVAEGDRTRVYLEPNADHRDAARVAIPSGSPTTNLPPKALSFRVQIYGMTKHSDLFTARQLTALTTFCDLVDEVRDQVRIAALTAGLGSDPGPLRDGGSGAVAYAEAVSVYLGLGVSRLADMCNSLCRWENTRTQVRNLFGRQAIPMVWDFAENNVFNGAGGDYLTSLNTICNVLETLGRIAGNAVQRDAQSTGSEFTNVLVSTDPPYYDNIGYADLSDFFYVWLRRCIGPVFPDVCSTLLVPKSQELVATPYRFDGDKKRAEEFFESGLNQVFGRLREVQDERFPLTIYYASKQAETTGGGCGFDRVGDDAAGSHRHWVCDQWHVAYAK